MNLLEAYQALKILGPTFLTIDAAAILNLPRAHVSVTLARLAKANTLIHLARGRWAYSDSVDPLLLPNILSYPMMAYVSLYSALYYHGLISQIPSVVFAVSNGKTKIFQTSLAKVSLHSIQGPLFTGYEAHGKHMLLMATPEKALFDTLYFAPARSHFFKALTELELPDGFKRSAFDSWLALVNNKGRRVLISQALDVLMLS